MGHIGALLPDMDTAAADIWHSVPLGHAVGEVASQAAFGHRNLTHSLLGVGLFGYLAWYLIGLLPSYWGLDPLWLWRAFIIGYGLHLLADALTEEGIPLLWPAKHNYGFPPKPFEEVRIVAGGWFENLLIFPLVNLILILGIWLNWGLIKLYLLR